MSTLTNFRFCYNPFFLFDDPIASPIRYGLKKNYKTGFSFFFGYKRIPVQFLRRKTYALKKWYKYLRSRRRLCVVSTLGWYYVNKWIPLLYIHRRGRRNLLLHNTAFGVCIRMQKYNFLVRNELSGEIIDYSLSFFCPALTYLRSVKLEKIKAKKARIYVLSFFLKIKNY